MKKLTVLLAAALFVVTEGCGGGSAAPFTFIARQVSDDTPHLFVQRGTKETPREVSIAIPEQAEFISVNRQGTAVIYCRNTPTTFDIFLMATDGVEKQLTHGSNGCQAVFSPDGKTIAFVSGVDGVPQVWTMNIDGSLQRALYVAPFNTLDQFFPEFSPDGKSVSFYVSMFPNNVVVGPSHRLLTQGPVWSPRDGRHKTISHTVQPNDGAPTVSGLYTMGLTDNVPTFVHTPVTAFILGPAVYSADGKKLLYTDRDGGRWNIYSVNLDGSGVTALTNNTTTDAFSPLPYGDHILFNQLNQADTSFDIYVMDQNGGNATLVDSMANTFESLLDAYWSNQ